MVRPVVGGGGSPAVLSWPSVLCFSREYRGARTHLRRALVLEELSPALHNTNFSCIFADPEQTAQRHVVLAQLWVRKLREGFHGQEEPYGAGGGGQAWPRVASS